MNTDRFKNKQPVRSVIRGNEFEIRLSSYGLIPTAAIIRPVLPFSAR